MTVKLGVAALLSATILSLGAASFARAEDAPAQRVSRSEIWHNGPIKFVDTTPFKKVPPYTIGFSTSAPAVVHDGWQSVLLRVRVTRKTRAPSVNDVKAMLQHGKEASLTMHCSGSHFVVDALERG